jgi:hypothetical protein
MKANRTALYFVICGLTLAAACFARLLYIERTWNDSTFHLSMDTSVPAAFLFIGLGVAAVGIVISIVRWVRQSQYRVDRK